MPNLFFAEQELKHAEESFHLFRQMKDFDPTNKNFYDFVLHLDLVFVKAERGCQDIRKKFEPFQGKYKKLRREDPLLAYLKNARDAINHDIGILYDLAIVSDKIVDYIEMSHQDSDGNWITEKHPMFPAEIQLNSFKINNKIWEPPTVHLGYRLIQKNSPSEVANLGIKFYKDFLKEINSKFIK